MKTRPRHAFTLIELLTVMAIIGLLAALVLPVLDRVRSKARAAVSASNLRQLASATLAYVGDNREFFPPGMSLDNLTRWHGARTSTKNSAAFDASKGWLGPYLGRDGRVKKCPEFSRLEPAPESFELSSGGYGYNMTYLGGPAARGTAKDPYRPTRFSTVSEPGRTILFTTTAFAVSGGLQEYPFSEPPRWLTPAGALSGHSQPSVHFRFGGKALVAWCDGRVSTETPNDQTGPNFYNGDNATARIGWFGPVEHNGYWNPRYSRLAQ